MGAACGNRTHDLRITRSFASRRRPAASRARAGQTGQDVLVVSHQPRLALLIMCPQRAPVEEGGPARPEPTSSSRTRSRERSGLRSRLLCLLTGLDCVGKGWFRWPSPSRSSPRILPAVDELEVDASVSAHLPHHDGSPAAAPLIDASRHPRITPRPLLCRRQSNAAGACSCSQVLAVGGEALGHY